MERIRGLELFANIAIYFVSGDGFLLRKLDGISSTNLRGAGGAFCGKTYFSEMRGLRGKSKVPLHFILSDVYILMVISAYRF